MKKYCGNCGQKGVKIQFLSTKERLVCRSCGKMYRLSERQQRNYNRCKVLAYILAIASLLVSGASSMIGVPFIILGAILSAFILVFLPLTSRYLLLRYGELELAGVSKILKRYYNY